MSTQKKNSVSLANTPVRRALARAKRSTLLLLLAAGVIVGYLYKNHVAEKPVQQPPSAAQQQR